MTLLIIEILVTYSLNLRAGDSDPIAIAIEPTFFDLRFNVTQAEIDLTNDHGPAAATFDELKAITFPFLGSIDYPKIMDMRPHTPSLKVSSFPWDA